MRKRNLDGAVRVTVAFAAGLWLGIVMAYRIVPTDEQLWAFAGASLGAVIAIGGAALLFVFQRDLVVRSELAAVAMARWMMARGGRVS